MVGDILEKDTFILLICGINLIAMGVAVFYQRKYGVAIEELEKMQKKDTKKELEIARREEGFKNIMDYDVNVALGRNIIDE